MTRIGNRGEWGELYTALNMIGEGKLNLGDDKYLKILKLKRQEEKNLVVTYKIYGATVAMYENGSLKGYVDKRVFLTAAERLLQEIENNRGVFEASFELNNMLNMLNVRHIKTIDENKGEVYLSAKESWSDTVHQNMAFSIKTFFGHNPTLFNTASSSGVVYCLDDMNDDLMEEINNIYGNNELTAVQRRCDALIDYDCNPTFVGFPITKRFGYPVFEQNLKTINPQLIPIIERILYFHFFCHSCGSSAASIVRGKAKDSIKSLIYAMYCGMTASKPYLDLKKSEGGLIKTSKSGEVIGYLDSEEFKDYLYNNCYFDYPSTDVHHGNYGKVYRGNDGKYYFNLNFQVRCR